MKPLLRVKHNCNMQYVKQHDNLGKFPYAASITRGVKLDKTLTVPVITLVFSAEWDQLG